MKLTRLRVNSCARSSVRLYTDPLVQRWAHLLYMLMFCGCNVYKLVGLPVYTSNYIRLMQVHSLPNFYGSPSCWMILTINGSHLKKNPKILEFIHARPQMSFQKSLTKCHKLFPDRNRGDFIPDVFLNLIMGRKPLWVGLWGPEATPKGSLGVQVGWSTSTCDKLAKMMMGWIFYSILFMV